MNSSEYLCSSKFNFIIQNLSSFSVLSVMTEFSSSKRKIHILFEILRSLTALKNLSFKICSSEFEIV